VLVIVRHGRRSPDTAALHSQGWIGIIGPVSFQPSCGQRTACPHVGGKRDIDLGRPRLVPVVHEVDEGLLIDRQVQAFIPPALLADGGGDSAMIIVAGIYDRVIRQRKKLLANRVEQLFRGAALQIRAAVASNEQGIPGEHGTRKEIAQTTIGMAGCGQPCHRRPAEAQTLAVSQE
jgi:hypothetical protein